MRLRLIAVGFRRAGKKAVPHRPKIGRLLTLPHLASFSSRCLGPGRVSVVRMESRVDAEILQATHLCPSRNYLPARRGYIFMRGELLATRAVSWRFFIGTAMRLCRSKAHLFTFPVLNYSVHKLAAHRPQCASAHSTRTISPPGSRS